MAFSDCGAHDIILEAHVGMVCFLRPGPALAQHEQATLSHSDFPVSWGLGRQAAGPATGNRLPLPAYRTFVGVVNLWWKLRAGACFRQPLNLRLILSTHQGAFLLPAEEQALGLEHKRPLWGGRSLSNSS